MEKKKIPGLPHLQFHNLFCIGRNYVEHAKELNNEVPSQPLVFLKPTGSIIFDGDKIQIPHQSENVQHEVELAVAIDKTGKDIPKEEALEYVGGYGIGIDVTARDIQQKAKEKGHPWTVAKGFDTFAPLSTFVEKDLIEDPQNLHLQISVNNEGRQSDSTKLMIHTVADLIHYLSTIFTLQPGDIILTGTPKGVSAITTGDTIKASLSNGLATISVTVE
ncbi:fumarylacetoacetate hydrolase family protein [Fodinibius sp.]|uniref:fumarylacetoacetate hydrolase family protein n=1 Tax=Fodinibius sp. TaxID=1872440 RepID=UPI002ACD3401|nr:fumarylacetoacetate hydrolase family protein [Fodinibius sp.]MDZ7660703.1 fumarylacetoacetate hydrolase family protein [Fodinibius sp.]